MEDAILGNSKGATYKSFILDVEIVIKKEGTANIAEGRVKSKNTRENNEDHQNKPKTGGSKRNLNQDVYVVTGGETNLRDVSNERNSDLLESCKISNKKNALSDLNQTRVSGENNRTDKQHHCKRFHSNETNSSGTSSEKQQKKKRTHKSAHSSKTFKSKTEPIDFLECNRIFLCNYLQLPRQNSDSALCCNYLGTLNKILQQEYVDNLDKKLKNARSVGEIFSLIKPTNSIWNEVANNKLCSSTKDLGNIYSCGDCNIPNNLCKAKFHNLYRVLKTNSGDKNLFDTPIAEFHKSESLITDLSNLNSECNVGYENIKEVSNSIIIKDIVVMGKTKNNFKKKKTLAFLQRIKSIKKSLQFLNPIKLFGK